MVDYAKLKKKFRPKDPSSDDRRAKTRAAVKRIAREYATKRADLGLDEPRFRRTPLYYGLIVLVMTVIAISFIGVATGKLSLGKKPVSKAAIQSRQSVDALAVAIGRYKFHVGRYPTTEEGIEELARIRPGLKGWFGPYIKKTVPDPWGNAYVYEARTDGSHPVLYSKGPDGRAGTTDDVLPDQSTFDEPFRDTTWTNHWVPYQYRGIVLAPNEKAREAIREEVKKY